MGSTRHDRIGDVVFWRGMHSHQGLKRLDHALRVTNEIVVRAQLLLDLRPTLDRLSPSQTPLALQQEYNGRAIKRAWRYMPQRHRHRVASGRNSSSRAAR